MEHYTTIEQSKKLVELGLNLDTADMTYCAVVEGTKDKTSIKGWEVVTGTKKWEVSVNAIKNNSFSSRNGHIIPCWSLGALLDIIPSISNPVGINSFRIAVPSLVKEQNWVCKYDGDLPLYFSTESDTTSKVFFAGNTPVEAVCRMVCWLLENGYIKKGE